MKDNFDLKKYLKENKTIENSNRYLSNTLKEDEQKDQLRSKVRKMILKEMEDMDYPTMDEDLYEAKDEEEEISDGEGDVEVEDETEEVEVVDSEEFDETDETEEGSGDEDGVMSHLEAAMEAARDLGDEKLIDQLGNTITFYTRQHIAK
jgi:hypothetical protein